MQASYETIYHTLERNHFWFRARRHYILNLLARWRMPKSAAILEVGCSGGPLLRELAARGYGNVSGIDLSESGIALCHEQNIPNTSVQDATRMNFADGQFDLIIASDILEHIPDEAAALREWRRVLKPGGKLLVMVPAFMFLWSQHDVVNLHYRRYTRGSLTRAMRGAGFRISMSGYWNGALFPPVAAVRLARRLLPHPKERGDIRPTPGLLNAAAYQLLKLENTLALMGLRAPIGVSVIAAGE